MLSYEATTLIHADAAHIWGILTDASGYPAWDPYCERIEGSIAQGNKIKAFTSLAPGRAFPVTVKTFEPQRRMTWESGMPLGLFRGVRSFTLAPEGDAIRFSVREEFSGPMLVLIGRTIPDMNEPFARFCQGLKDTAER